jgi:hypothetical protein
MIGAVAPGVHASIPTATVAETQFGIEANPKSGVPRHEIPSTGAVVSSLFSPAEACHALPNARLSFSFSLYSPHSALTCTVR